MLNPGPVNVAPAVREALGFPDVCHREAEVLQLITDVRAKVARVCGGDDRHTSVLLTGSGTAALEATLSSVVPPDGRILVLDNGHYGERMYCIVAVHRIANMRLEFGWHHPIDLGAVDKALADDTTITHVAVVHHETSTGRINPLRELGALVRRHGRSLVVDAISSLGSEQLDMDLDEIDWCVGTANKCLEGVPGMSFVCAARSSLNALESVPARSFYLDLYGHYVSQERVGVPLFTPAVQVLYAFGVALDAVIAEGVQARTARYAALADQVRTGVSERGLQIPLAPETRSTSVTNVEIPAGITYAQLHDDLRAQGYVVYGVQERAGDVFRVANMGYLNGDHIAGFLDALDRVLLTAVVPG